MLLFTLNQLSREEIDNLVRQAQEQNAKAFGRLYDLLAKRIYNYVYFRVKNKLEAEDITEEVFLKALEALGSYELTEAPFTSWLFRIAHNLVIDFYRRSGKFSAGSMEEAEGVASPEKGLDELVSGKIEQERLLRAISKLNDDHREVIVLKFVEGLSNKEVGVIMDKTEGGIKSLQHRALHSLRRYLEGEIR